MTDKDDTFGHDPQVRFMRRIFASIEAAQTTFLKSTNISPIDKRLREVREDALKCFERSWIEAMNRMNVSADEIAVDIYLICLRRSLAVYGFDVPDQVFPHNATLTEIIEEVLG